jgi:hypothetical protein
MEDMAVGLVAMLIRGASRSTVHARDRRGALLPKGDTATMASEYEEWLGMLPKVTTPVPLGNMPWVPLERLRKLAREVTRGGGAMETQQE